MLEGKNISFVRDGFPLFSGLSFVLEPGERLTIHGANGAGKSTLLRLLTGLLPLKNEMLLWNGERISKTNCCLYQQNLLYIGHTLCLHPEAHVHDQLQIWQNLYKIPAKNMEQALENWGLGSLKHKKISHLSQGQQKRLSLSRCIWLKRSLWILDEPEAGLDQEGQSYLAHTLSIHRENGGMIVQASHQNSTPSLRAMCQQGEAIQKVSGPGLLHPLRGLAMTMEEKKSPLNSTPC